VMGTGTPTVTVSGLSAANAILRKKGIEPFVFKKDMKNYVNIVERNCGPDVQNLNYPEDVRVMMSKASRCQYCEDAACMKDTSLDIRGMMRRVTVGNTAGAKKIINAYHAQNPTSTEISESQNACIMGARYGNPVEIAAIASFLTNKSS